MPLCINGLWENERIFKGELYALVGKNVPLSVRRSRAEWVRCAERVWQDIVCGIDLAMDRALKGIDRCQVQRYSKEWNGEILLCSEYKGCETALLAAFDAVFYAVDRRGYSTAAVVGSPRIWRSTVFEHRTPVGFSTADSTAKQDFVLGAEIAVRADLNQAATPTYPVIGHFHSVERSVQVEGDDVDGLQTDIAVDDDGTIHMAWIAQELVSPVSTPVYYVRYARSEDSGRTFSSSVSVSGSLRFDLLTVNVAGSSSGFSTLDLEIDSRGNPRVAYAMNHSPDGHTARFTGSGDADNVYFNYSQDWGASWLPANSAVVVNDTVTTGSVQGRASAFPRMVVDQRDNVFISYVRGSSQGTGSDDVMLAKVDRSTTPFNMELVGSLGTAGSSGGIRISPEGGATVDRI